MSIMISAFASSPRDFSQAENEAIDAASFFLSEGNWREHLREIFITDPGDDDLEAEALSREVEAFIDYHNGKVGLSDHTTWHLGVAQKLRALIAAARTHGCDRVGAAG